MFKIWNILFFKIIICSSLSCISSKKAKEKIKAECQIMSANESVVTGLAIFSEENKEVVMSIYVKNLTQGLHAIHIHEFGNCSSNDAKSAGGHWNPDNQNHGKWGSSSHHKGDIANLKADSLGIAKLKFKTPLWCLDCQDSLKNIIGKSIIIHEGIDDFKSQPSGNAGKRIGCGVIKIKV